MKPLPTLALTLLLPLTPHTRAQQSRPDSDAALPVHILLGPASEQPSPEPFVRMIYQLLPGAISAPAFVGGTGASHIYAKPLLSGVRKSYSRPGGALFEQVGYNPLCICQAPDHLAITSLTFTPGQRPAHVDAHVTLELPAQNTRNLILHLIQTTHGWRIDDVTTAAVPTLRGLLTRTGPPPGP